MKKFTIIGSHLCPNTLYAICKCKEAGYSFAFQDISASLADLRALLALRDEKAEFEGARKEGRLGIPCFVLEDGSVTLDLGQVLEQKAR